LIRIYPRRVILRHPDPPLADDVVVLRPWSLDDVPDAVRSCNDPEIRRFLPPIPIPYTERDAREFIADAVPALERGQVRLVGADPATGRLMGAIAIRILEPGLAQTGYWVAPGDRGRGVAPRMLRLLSRWTLTELPIERLQLITDTENPASMAVAERSGFVREGRLRRWYDLRGEHRDAVMFSLLAEDVA
jgi:[ribosomal protein S5]-alanine N-acetyltransferase